MASSEILPVTKAPQRKLGHAHSTVKTTTVQILHFTLYITCNHLVFSEVRITAQNVMAFFAKISS